LLSGAGGQMKIKHGRTRRTLIELYSIRIQTMNIFGLNFGQLLLLDKVICKHTHAERAREKEKERVEGLETGNHVFL